MPAKLHPGPAGRRDAARVVNADCGHGRRDRHRRARPEQELRRSSRGQGSRAVRCGAARSSASSGRTAAARRPSIRMLCGLLTPDSGERHVPRLRHPCARSQAIKRHVGYMTQRFSLWEDLTIRENLRLRRADVFAGRRRDAGRRRRSSGSGSTDRAGPARRASSPAAGSSAWRWPRACCTSRSCCCSTSRPRASIPRRAAISGTRCTSSPARGITVLVSTHYMDEAERCHKLGYILDGRLLAQGTADEIIASQTLAAWSVEVSGLAALAPRLRALPAVDQVAAFGSSCTSPAPMPRRSTPRLAPFKSEPGRTWQRIEPGLEDVFIHLMQSRSATTCGGRRGPPRHDRHFLVLALARHRRQGVHPAQARPADVRHDRRHPDHPARAVRVRDQLRSQAACRRCCSTSTSSEFSRSIASALANSDYFAFVGEAAGER